ncbi:hypothetical protein GCM10025780_00930 [Frondihabitans cladoniiphilus]|uniref:Uncharacterized protein n=1 Tax=Frondihabitans cladoniiphilus TaxID=715785 RepID=A0ABP8VJQ6_9MICO
MPPKAAALVAVAASTLLVLDVDEPAVELVEQPARTATTAALNATPATMRDLFTYFLQERQRESVVPDRGIRRSIGAMVAVPRYGDTPHR